MPAETVIFTHGDCDGICSGALALAAHEGAPVFFSNPVSILDDLDEAKDADRIVVCDIAINLPRARDIKNKVTKLSKKAEVIYIDHHPKPPRFNVSWLVHDTNSCAAQLTYERFRKSLDPDMSRVAIYGAIGDYKDQTPLAMELLKTWDSRSLYYEAGTIAQGIAIGRKDYDHKRDIVQLLSKNVLPSQIPSLAKNAIKASLMEEELRLRIEKSVVRLNSVSYVIDMDGFISKAAIYAHIYGGTCVGVAAEYLKSKDVYDVSIRAKGDCNLNVLVDMAARRCGGTGGGHPMAAGGRIPAACIMDFINDLDAMLGSRKK
ncbi:putative phosphoesterase [Methanocella paludicola SANAE]|uniref:Phosphoesterase n=1 Tax=Methanocella paludicola (strain DSM 17711 / JCM 13418 / NBRC 101707 / SANAE) TaxID=304371 RepID=D1Z196_METPS|nr:DHHA1 domain-containing protein [Methanocella paludicola]BAI62468.1 putative phosphoesterase [Methanocella paludicola SANAE]